MSTLEWDELLPEISCFFPLTIKGIYKGSRSDVDFYSVGVPIWLD